MELNSSLDEVVDSLCRSFDQQSQCYTKLWEVTKKAAGALAMSRGDFTKTLTILQEKETLLAEIMQLKQGVAGEIATWQEEKTNASQDIVDKLNGRLDTMETVIRRFLTAEKQLEKQITFYQKGTQ